MERTFTTRQGFTFTSTLSDTEAYTICLTLTSNSFAQDLCRQMRKWQTLRGQQQVWLHKLAVEAQNPQTAPQSQSAKLDRISALMQQARASLKRPVVRIRMADGTKLKLSVMGELSRYAGQVCVKTGSFDDGVYFGRIDVTGDFIPSRNLSSAVLDTLKAINENPVEALATLAKESGVCCYCDRELTDDRSVKAGYGPVCAKHYGLAWGEVA